MIRNLSHIAIILDGNARWAKSQGLSQKEGHIQGAKTARLVLDEALQLGIDHMSFFLFSNENWGRDSSEVAYLFGLLSKGLDEHFSFLIENKISLQIFGNTDQLSKPLQAKLNYAVQKTALEKPRLKLGLAINYGGKQDLLQAFEKIRLNHPDQAITSKLLNENLMTHPFPHPNLIIRTGKWQRLSNFFLWQSAYSELYFSQKLWPEFTRQDFKKAVEFYNQTTQNFGARQPDIESL